MKFFKKIFYYFLPSFLKLKMPKIVDNICFFDIINMYIFIIYGFYIGKEFIN